MIKIISFLQVFTIILVVIGHTFIGEICETPLIYLHDWIYGFHMPMFMVLSGYLFSFHYEKNVNQQTIGTFLRRKALRLLLPYFILSTIVFFLKSHIPQYAARPISFSVTDYFHQLLFPYDNVMGHFWFLPTLMIIFVIVIFIAKTPLKMNKHLILLVLFVINIVVDRKSIGLLNLSGVAYYLFYFYLGMYIEKMKIIEKFNNTYLYLNIFLLLVINIMIVFLPEEYVMRAQLSGIFGIVFTICLGLLYIRQQKKFLDHLNGSSYTIFLYHWFPQVFSNVVLINILHVHWSISFIFAVVLGIYLPWLIYRYEVSKPDNKLKLLLRIINGMK